MDFRQYDNALGRFHCIDPVDHYSQSPYSGLDNNPVFWADPSGADVITLPSGAGFEFTGSDAGAFFNSYIDILNGAAESSFTTSNPVYEQLNEMTITRSSFYSSSGGGGSQSMGLLGRIMFHTYENSAFYKNWRAERSSKTWDSFQSDLEWFGAIPIIGEPVDLFNAGISAIRGNGKDALLNVASSLPVLGWVTTGLKAVNKIPNKVASTVFREITGMGRALGEGIPNSVYNYTSKDGTLISKYFYNDEGKVFYEINLRDFNSSYGIHGHIMTTPGSIGSGHTGDHIEFMLIPQNYW